MKAKTYNLRTKSSFISPNLMNNLRGNKIEAVVSEDGTIDVNGETLLFSDGETLKAGEEVVVSLSRNIYCQSKKELVIQEQFEEKKRIKRSLEIKAFEKEAEDEFVKPMNNILEYNLTQKQILTLLDETCKKQESLYETYKAYWGRHGSDEKEKSFARSSACGKALGILIRHIYKNFNYKHDINYAYSPRENVGSKGKDHIVLREDAQKGRIKRKKDDVLCSPNKEFWGLENLDNESPESLCKKCVETMIKLSFDNTKPIRKP